MLCCSVSVCVWAVDGATEVQILTPLQPPDGLVLSCMQIKVEAGTIDFVNVQLP